jgi:hypothetical protein
LQNKINTLKTNDSNAQTDEFKLNGEIFKKFLEHYEKRANGVTEQIEILNNVISPKGGLKLAQSFSNSNLKTQENYPAIKSLRNLPERRITTAKTLTRPKSEYKFDKASSNKKIYKYFCF